MATKNPKDAVLVNCRDVPETICVETRFISQAASKQNSKYDHFYHLTSTETFELAAPQEQIIPANSTNPISIPTFVLQTKPTLAAGVSVPQNHVSHQAERPCTMLPIGSALTSANNNINCFINLPTIQSQNSAASMPQKNTSPLQTLNFNALDTTTNSLGNSNCISMNAVTNSYSSNVHLCDSSSYNKKSIAVQCELDELNDLDIEWPEIDQDNIECDTNLETENDFLKYIEENSTQHRNSKECLICGELCKSKKYFYGHMAIHRGSKVLCYKCGKYLDHDKLLLKHKCKRARQLEKAFLQCPHHKCSVKAISAQELFDHINEHGNNRMYKCSACKKSFCTGQEFLRHLLIRAKCYTSAKRKLFRVYGLESQRDRTCRVRVFTLHTFKKRTTLVKTFLSKRVAKLGYCRICLKHFPNNFVYNRHRVKCITKFRKRLLRKKLKHI